jgi:sulfate adenylyltransferase large subunit
VFSLRNAHHRWDPKRQRPEPWRLYNARKRRGESLRVFPLSNWTELDIWLYIHQERIPVVPLYFAAPRPVVERGGTLIVVDDERLPLAPGETPQIRNVRFRTLGCYPLTGAVESEAASLPEIIRETVEASFSERRDRVIDHDGAASMGAQETGRLFLMNAQPKPGDFALDAFLRQQDRKSLLRFVACGSVDHGKSTLIGRLLYESKLVFDDQLDELKSDSRKYGTQGKELDFALLLDGLAAEREQKITIDVAYRFFTTERRKFIVADAPGHEQYTRNMATGASTADLALILVNAQAGLTRQTRRHSLIVSTLGVRHLVIAVNKMDLVGWSQDTFAAIEAEFRSFAAELGVSDVVCIPMSARDGDNVVARSQRMDWYRGPTLLEHLEQVEPAASPRGHPFRMPVQLVNRPSADFRGYSGLIANGDAYVGMPVRIMPSERISSIDRIVTFDGDVERAAAGQSVTITLADEIDTSRGDVLADASAPPAVTDRLSARVVWMGKRRWRRAGAISSSSAPARRPRLSGRRCASSTSTPAPRSVSSGCSSTISGTVYCSSIVRSRSMPMPRAARPAASS